MGLDANGARFLLHARKLGAEFDSTLMIGRQDLHATKDQLVDLLREYHDVCVDDAVPRLQESTSGFAEDFIECLGGGTVDSMDHSDFEGAAICHDLNEPIPDSLRQRYDVVLDGGTLEHVFDVRQAYQNCMEMVKVGGHYLGISPSNNFMGHGFYQFSPEFFFEAFSPSNGFRISQVILFEHRRNAPWYEVVAPTDIQSRVSLKNSERTYVLVVAERISEVVPFTCPPQQSDYEAAWEGKGTKAPLRSMRDTSEGGLMTAITENVRRLQCSLMRRSYFEPLYFRRIR